MQRELYKYNPQRMEKWELEETFVGRWEIYDSLIEGLRNSADKKHNQHIILKGPRGIGKTHILSMVYFKVKDDEELSQKWISLQFCEEEFGIGNLRGFFLRVLEELGRETNDVSITEFKDKICAEEDYEKDADKIYAFLKDYLKWKNKKILLLIDNIDLILNRLKDIELKKLRSILMNERYIMVYGSTITLFKEFAGEDRPFYRLFMIKSVDELKQEDFEELLWKRVKLDGKKETFEKIHGLPAKLKALYHLTGGNPRLLLILYQFLTISEVREVVFYLNCLLDDHNQYFLDKMSRLSDQQQIIVDAIAKEDLLITPSEVARKTGIKINTVTANISTLTDLGFLSPVKISQRRNVTYYDTSERLFKIWYQMRTGGRHKRRIEFLVNFLTIWYSLEELEKEREILEEILQSMKELSSKEEIAFLHERLEYIEEAISTMVEREVAIKDLRVDKEKYTKAMELGPKDAFTYFIRGNVYYWKGLYDEAIEEYTRAIELDPKYAAAYYNRGIAYAKKGLYDEAIEEYTKAIELDPQDVDAYNNRANLYANKCLYDKAIKDYTKVIELAPKYVFAYYNRGITYVDKCLYDEAIEDYTKAIELDSKYVDAYNNRGTAYVNKCLYDKAIEDYTKVIELNPKYAAAYYNRGIAYTKKGLYDEAIEDYTKAIELDSKYAAAYNNRGFAYAKKGLYDEAIEDYTKAIELDPKDAVVYNNRGVAYSNKCLYDKAIEDYTNAMELHPQYTLAYYNRGLVYTKKGLYDEAIEDYNEYARIISATARKEDWEEYIADLTRIFEKILKAERYKDAAGLFEILETYAPKEITETLYPMKLVIDYFVSGDKTLIERQPAEFRDIVEEILQKIEAKS